jgi:glycosyltransferase involved in cell wall biosynthesis
MYFNKSIKLGEREGKNIMARILKIASTFFESASRDKRELSVLSEMGHEVIFMLRGDQDENLSIKGINVYKRSTRPIGNAKFLRPFSRLLTILLWANEARRIKPDCISGHDLIGLTIGWLSTLFLPKDKRPLLVYDAHEYEKGRITYSNVGKLSQWLILKAEHFLIKKSEFSIMVNDSIADAVRGDYKLDDRPVVVRNVAPYWQIEDEKCLERRAQFCDMLNVSQETFIVMYHGGIIRSRCVETLINALQYETNTVAVILGNGDDKYISELKKLAEDLNVSNRLLFHPAVPIDDLWQYVGAADVDVSLAKNQSLNHYYMLPNKIFESIQSLTPVIASDFPEIKKIIQGYNVGLCIDPDNVKSVTEAIKTMRTKNEVYNSYKSNLLIAKEELCWEEEKKVLIDAYENILHKETEKSYKRIS